MTMTQPTPATRRTVPRLDLSGPRTLGLVAVFATAALVCLAAMVSVDSGSMTTARGRLRAEAVQLRHADGGVILRLAAKEGTLVDAGALIATLDARLIDSQIAGLRRQMDGSQLHVSGLKQEAEALAASDRLSAQRQRLAGLEAQIAASEQEGLGLQVRLAMAEQEKLRTEIRSPLAGRIVKIAGHESASIAPNGVVAELQPASDRFVLDATWPMTAARDAQVGQRVAVWPRDAMPWARPYQGRIERRALGGEQIRLSVAVELAGSDLEAAQPRDAEQLFSLQLVTGTPSLLASFVSPLFASSRPAAPIAKAQP